jgi:hypothetical protein
MSYYTRRRQPLPQVQKAYNPDQPRVPAGEPGGGQWAPVGGGGEKGHAEGMAGVRAVPGGLSASEVAKMREERFEQDQQRMANLGSTIRHVPVSLGRSTFGIERVEETPGKGYRARGTTGETFPSVEAARAHAEVLNRLDEGARAFATGGKQTPYSEGPAIPEARDGGLELQRRISERFKEGAGPPTVTGHRAIVGRGSASDWRPIGDKPRSDFRPLSVLPPPSGNFRMRRGWKPK